MIKVKIKKVPVARTGYQVQGGLVNDVPAMGGADIDSYTGKPKLKFNRTLKAVPREEANLEAEGRETAMVNTGNIPAFYTISGPRHAQGGVPLNLPDDSFIFSDFREMRIKDPELLAKFGKAVKKGQSFTPAELSKQYDINKYRQILQDPNSDKLDKKTAEIMIRNYNMKLGALALAQESKKGFPQGIPAVAKPFMEANGLSEEDFIPKEEEEATEPGMMAEGEEMMAEENQAPETMPDGSPVAMPQGEPMMPPQGMQPPMQYGGFPMAAYGMEMGGYGMPFYNIPTAQDGAEVSYNLVDNQGNPVNTPSNYVPPGVPSKPDLSNFDNMDAFEKMNIIRDMQMYPESYTDEERQILSGLQMSPEEMMNLNQPMPMERAVGPMNRYGGLYKYNGGGGKKRAKTEKELKFKKDQAKPVKEAPKGGDWVKTGDNQWSRGSVTTGSLDGMKSTTPGKITNKSIPAYTEDVCRAMKIKGSEFYMKDPSTMFGKGMPFSAGLPEETKAEIIAKLQNCLPAEALQEEEEHVYLEPESVNEKQCECTYPDGTVELVPINEDGTCPCEKEVEDYAMADYGPEIPVDNYAPWWLQDTVNSVGALGDYTGINKYLPATEQVDLEEPNPTFLDPTRELAAQSEQANIASAASNEFAGNAQQAGARLAAIQGQGATQAANTLSNINNQNVNIANQFEGQQVGIRNQENLMRHQLWNDLYDKNVIANQQYDNSRAQARANLRQAYNTAVTNRAKTDAMNQMYPNYKVDPSTGGFMNYIPNERDPNPIKPEDEIAYAQSLEAAGLPKEVIATMVKERMRRGNQGSSSVGPDPNVMAAMYGQRGGFLKNGGFVYGDMMFPFIL